MFKYKEVKSIRGSLVFLDKRYVFENPVRESCKHRAAGVKKYLNMYSYEILQNVNIIQGEIYDFILWLYDLYRI